jgi:hypothetical protein
MRGFAFRARRRNMRSCTILLDLQKVFLGMTPNLQMYMISKEHDRYIRQPAKRKHCMIQTWITVFEPTKSSIFFQSRSNLNEEDQIKKIR